MGCRARSDRACNGDIAWQRLHQHAIDPLTFTPLACEWGKCAHRLGGRTSPTWMRILEALHPGLFVLSTARRKMVSNARSSGSESREMRRGLRLEREQARKLVIRHRWFAGVIATVISGAMIFTGVSMPATAATPEPTPTETGPSRRRLRMRRRHPPTRPRPLPKRRRRPPRRPRRLPRRRLRREDAGSRGDHAGGGPERADSHP